MDLVKLGAQIRRIRRDGHRLGRQDCLKGGTAPIGIVWKLVDRRTKDRSGGYTPAFCLTHDLLIASLIEQNL